jgi:hypothetical protein
MPFLSNFRICYSYWAIGLCFIGCIACDTDQDTQRKETAKQQLQQRQSIRESQKTAIGKRKERNKKGDTLALSQEELASYLPESYKDYISEGQTVGNDFQLSGSRYAGAEQNYLKGTAHLRITLTDYNGAVPPHAGIMAMWDTTVRTETRKVKAGGVRLYGTMRGWELLDKRRKRAELTLAVSDRILLVIKADQQSNTEFVKAVALSMKLKELAEK